MKVFTDAGIGVLRLSEAAAVRNIYFAADNRLYPLRLAFTEKAQGGKHIAVVGQREGCLSEVFGGCYQFLYGRSAVQQRIVGVHV